jgi:hypothetical protein
MIPLQTLQACSWQENLHQRIPGTKWLAKDDSKTRNDVTVSDQPRNDVTASEQSHCFQLYVMTHTQAK